MKKHIWKIAALSIALAALYYIASNPHPFMPKTVEPVIRAQDTVTVEYWPAQRAQKEVDSIVKNGISLYAYHDGKIVASRPNKTWNWLVLDSAGWRICMAKSKRRDSL